MARKRSQDRVSYRIGVLIHDSLGNEFDALFPPDSDKRAGLNLSNALRPLVEEKFRELIQTEREKARGAAQRLPGRVAPVSAVPRSPAIPPGPKLGGR